MCEGCVDICPWKCIHMVQPSAIAEADDTEQPGEDPTDHVIFIIDDDVCTRCALCVDRCPTGVIIMGKAGRRPATAIPTPVPTTTATPTACGSRPGARAVAKTIDEQEPRSTPGADAQSSDDRCQGSQAWNSIFRPGLDLPEGLHRQPPQPVVRDHELGAVPPAPGQGEASRGEGELHALPRRARASSSSSCSRSPASS